MTNRYHLVVLSILVFGTMPLSAQKPDPSQIAAAKKAKKAMEEGDSELADYLYKWAEVMKEVHTLSITADRINKMKHLDIEEVFDGSIHFLNPGQIAMKMTNKVRKKQIEHLIIAESRKYQLTWVYQGLPVRNLVFPVMIKLKNGEEDKPSFAALTAFNDPIVDIMDVEYVNRRYELSLKKEDDNYLYLEMLPKTVSLKEVCVSRSRLVLNKTTFMPRQLWYRKSTGDTVLWNFTKVIRDEKGFDKKIFEPPVECNDCQIPKQD